MKSKTDDLSSLDNDSQCCAVFLCFAFFPSRSPRSTGKQSNSSDFLIGYLDKSDHVYVVITYIHVWIVRWLAPLQLAFHWMLSTRICSRCSRLINYGSISTWSKRLVSTSNETGSIPVNEENLAANDEIDRNVSRLPEDVYRHFKGRDIEPGLIISLAFYRIGLPPLEVKEQFHTRTKLRALWGKYGRKTGIDPKLCWPTQQEMDETIDDERVYNMELSEKLKIVKERREAKQKEFDQM